MMQTEDARYLKRKVKGGSIDVHPTEKAIIVNYEVEATILGEMGDPMLGEKKECHKVAFPYDLDVHPYEDKILIYYDTMLVDKETWEVDERKEGSVKVIRLKSLNETTDITALAQEVVGRCKLIHISKLPEVEQLLYYLQNRKETIKENVPNKATNDKKHCLGLQDPTPDFISDDGTEPSVNDIDMYVELLYEDVPAKIKASAMILRLTRMSDNLEELMTHGTVLGALTRVLREDWRKSVELSTNIMYIFFCFSAYTEFHHVIAKHKIGALCMTIAEHELTRYESWREDVEKRKQILSRAPNNEQALKDYESAQKKFQGLVNKQNGLLRIAFYLLLNLSEDVRVEIKMKNRGVVEMLIKALSSRKSPDLLILVLSFLKKLSIFADNKNKMASLDVIGKLTPLITCESVDLLTLSQRLMLNLSFDSGLRKRMVECGVVSKLSENLANVHPDFLPISTIILYHLSMDDKVRAMFSYTDCIPQLIQLILEMEPGPINIEIAALCINIACNKRNTQSICECAKGSALKYLVKRAFKFKDVLLLKMIRNMSQHSGPTKALFAEHIGLFAKTFKKNSEGDFALECLGTLGNLNIPEIDFELILRECNLMSFIQNTLTSGDAEDDLVLETVVLLGTVALDGNCAQLLAESGIIQILIELLNAKQEDDELVLQIAYVFYQMIWHEETRSVLITKTQAPAYLIDLMHDKNAQIRKVCDNTLDMIMEHDKDWAKRIKLEKFKWHNSQWIEMVETQQQDDIGDEDIYGDMLPAYLRNDDMLLYEPTFDEELLMENGQPEFIDEERNALMASRMIPPGFEVPPGYEPYLQGYDPESDPRFIQIPDGMEGYYPDPYMRPSSPNYMGYNEVPY